MAKRKRLAPPTIDSTEDMPATPSSNLPRGFDVGRPPIADVAHDAATTSALNEVAQTLTDARNEGRLIQKIPLAKIDETYLVRDRVAAAPEEMMTLIESLRARGQQTAIEVSALGNGRYGLISGWRRLTALRTLSADKESEKIDTILAIIRDPKDSSAAYIAMVEENEIRVGLSFYERARIVARAVDRGVYRTDRLALAALFAAVPRAKRSKIGSFITIVRALDEALTFPTALTEKSGLALAKSLDSDVGFAARLIAALQETPPATAHHEGQIIAKARDNEAPAPRSKPSPQVLMNGLSCVPQSNGDLLLQGAALADPEYRARLIAAVSLVK